jgi:hypothetical protein
MFSDTLCKKLLGKGIPGFVNRLANVGNMLYSCIDFIRIRKVTDGNYTNLDNEESRRFSEFSGRSQKIADY